MADAIFSQPSKRNPQGEGSRDYSRESHALEEDNKRNDSLDTGREIIKSEDNYVKEYKKENVRFTMQSNDWITLFTIEIPENDGDKNLEEKNEMKEFQMPADLLNDEPANILPQNENVGKIFIER